MRALLDTCVVIDALQNRKPFASNAQEIFIAAANSRFSGYITAKAVTDIYYLCHRQTHSHKESCEILSRLFSLFDVLDTCAEDCKRALLSDISDYEDAVMIETAYRESMDCIITRNSRDYNLSAVPVYTPTAFLGLF